MKKLKNLATAVGKTASVSDIREQKLLAAEKQENSSYQGRTTFPSEATAPPQDIGYAPYYEGMEIVVGMHIEMPLEMLVDNPDNPRAIYAEDDVQNMVHS